MEHAKTEKPEEQGMVNDKAVDEAEQYLAIAEETQRGIGIVLAVDQGKTVEDEHDGRGEPIMTLQDHGESEDAAGSQRNQEVDAHFAHPAVEGEGQIVPFGFVIGHDGDGGTADSQKREGEPDGSPYARGDGRDAPGIMREGGIEPDNRSRDNRSYAGEDADNDDRPSAKRLELR